MNKQPLTAIFFDWDRTLAYHGSPKNTLGERLTLMFHSAGLAIPQEEIEAALACYNLDVERGKVKHIDNPQTRREIVGLYSYILDYLGHEKSWELLVRLYGTYAMLPTFLYENSRKILHEVCERGLIPGIISNHSRSARPVMERMVGDLVPSKNIILSEELGVHKPAKTIYLRAAARIRTPPEQCLLVGDNLQVDAIGAVQEGGFGRGIWLNRNGCCKDPQLPADVACINSLNELPVYFSKSGDL
ncbi:MAG: HAD family hydrolase [Candidatus Promineifilaceae bacterium]|nr:HAD family hydrolase [Candidatus Promineifilaceae bacterium]